MTDLAERPTTTSSPSSRQLTGLRNQLTSDREQTIRLIDSVTEEMDAFVTARRDTATDDEHDPEGPTLAFERSQASAVLTSSMLHLTEIESALVRMDAGTYGRCATCGRDIAIGRLQVRPQAALCISCAGRLR